MTAAALAVVITAVLGAGGLGALLTWRAQTHKLNAEGHLADAEAHAKTMIADAAATAEARLDFQAIVAALQVDVERLKVENESVRAGRDRCESRLAEAESVAHQHTITIYAHTLTVARLEDRIVDLEAMVANKRRPRAEDRAAAKSTAAEIKEQSGGLP